MARKKAVVINREALHSLDLGIAEGLEALARMALAETRPPDAAPFGVGLIEGGGTISYVDGKKVGGDADKKPRGMKVRGQGVAVGVGFGFPARFVETGTVRQPARPFLSPAVVDVTGDRGAVEGAIRGALAKALVGQSRRIARAQRKAAIG